MKQAAFDKPGQDYPHPGQLGMLSDATPYRSACPVRRGARMRQEHVDCEQVWRRDWIG